MRLLNRLIDTPPRELYQIFYRKLYKDPSISGFDEKHPCVFVLSTGRVGSMTLARLLGLASNLYVTHEPGPKLFRLSKANYSYNFGNSEFSDSIFWTVREDLIKEALKLGRGYAETSPQGTFFAPVILKAIPSVKFIHLVRHPADIVTSGMRRNWFGGHPADTTRITPKINSEHHHFWNNLTQFEKNAWLWTETNQWILNFLESVPDNQQLTVHSENIYSNDQSLIENIFHFVGAEAPSEKQIRKVISKKHNKQIGGDFPSFSAWSPDMVEQLRDISGDLAKNLGYNF